MTSLVERKLFKVNVTQIFFPTTKESTVIIIISDSVSQYLVRHCIKSKCLEETTRNLRFKGSGTIVLKEVKAIFFLESYFI